MRSKTKYLLYREGRYYARIVIPKPLRPYLENKTELRIPLGADRRAALRQHPMAVADLMHQITLAERRAAEAQGIPQTPGRFPMTDAQLALRSYHQRLDQDTHARHSTNAYARISIDDGYAALLRMGIAGAASDAELEELIGHRIDHYRKMGNTTASPGTEAWRSLAMSLCVSEYEALERVFERDEGNFSGTPAHPLIRDAAPEVEDLPPVSLRGLFRDYIASRKLLGKGREAEKKWRPVIEHLRKHLGHDDARRITRQDVMAWRDDLLK